MDLLKDPSSNKKWIIVGIAGVIILIVVLVSLFFLFNGDKEEALNEDQPSTSRPKSPDGGSGVGGLDFDFPDSGVFEYEGETFVIPESLKKAKVVDFEYLGSSASFTVEEGEGGNISTKTYTFPMRALIFNVDNKKVELPSSLGGIKKDVEVLSYTDLASRNPEDVTHITEMVLVGDTSNSTYTQVMSMSRDNEDHVYIVNMATEKRYRLHAEGEVVNALSGVRLKPEDIKFGDRVIVFEGNTFPAESTEPIGFEDDYIPDIKPLEEKTPFVDLDNYDNTDYETIDVKSVYIFPNR